MRESFTHHAAQRAQQRCIPPIVLDWLHTYGQRTPLGAGAECLHFDKTARRALHRDLGGWAYGRMESKLDAYAVLSSAGSVITTGYRTKRLKNL